MTAIELYVYIGMTILIRIDSHYGFIGTSVPVKLKNPSSQLERRFLHLGVA
jgi:hypothetical protein